MKTVYRYPVKDDDRIRYHVGNTGKYEFEVYKKPYFFGLIGQKRWMHGITADEVEGGVLFCKFLVGRK